MASRFDTAQLHKRRVPRCTRQLYALVMILGMPLMERLAWHSKLVWWVGLCNRSSTEIPRLHQRANR